MKKLMITLLMLITTNSFATDEIKSGVIREFECNGPSGLGFIIVESRKWFTIKREAVKVNSKELCGAQPGEFSKLGNIGFDAVFGGTTSVYEVYIEDGFAYEIQKVEDVKYHKFAKGVRKYKNVGTHDVQMWFYKGPSQIHWFMDNIDELIEKYTTN